jgi:hypothetical protein
VLVLENLILKEASLPGFDLRRFSVLAEAGGSLYPLDFSLLYYHGADNSPLVKAEFYFPLGLYESYDIILTPVMRWIDALGCNLAAHAGPFTFWTDDSITFAKTFLTNRLSDTALETALAERSYLELCLGASYSPSFIDGLGVIEYRQGIVFANDDSVIEPLLSSVLVCLVQLDLVAGKLSPALTWIQSFHDASGALYLRLSLKPSLEFEARLTAPLFFGAPDTELGQFRDNYLLSAGIIWSF